MYLYLGYRKQGITRTLHKGPRKVKHVTFDSEHIEQDPEPSAAGGKVPRRLRSALRRDKMLDMDSGGSVQSIHARNEIGTACERAAQAKELLAFVSSVMSKMHDPCH
jgi:hypothetical protein